MLTMKITEKELSLLFPETEVEFAGKTFTIRPFSFAETRTVVRKLQEVIHLFGSELTAQALAEIYDKAFDGVADIIAMVYQLDRKTVEKLDIKSALAAINGIIRTNKSFFVDQVEAEINNIVTMMGMSEDQSQKP